MARIVLIRSYNRARVPSFLVALLCAACSDEPKTGAVAASGGMAGATVAASGTAGAGVMEATSGSGGQIASGGAGGSASVAGAGGAAGAAGVSGAGGGAGGSGVTDPGTEGDGDFYAAPPYEYGPDSEKKPGVPEGTLSEFEWNDSKTFPGTQRKVYVYVPAQYDPAKKTAVMIYQDGSEGWAYLNGDYRPRIVMDNLTAQKQIPIAVSIFIDHSQQRSYEYDSATGLYGQFVFEEILPEVESRYKLNLTHDPEGRAVIGESSGGIAAFSMAWWWPDQYRRVLSNSGSFVNIGNRGGDTYKDMVLVSEPKPLRISLQDGSNDINQGPRMNWSEENQALAAALKTKGYHYRFMFGEDAHGGMHGAVDFPDALRWLWRGYPVN